MKKLLGFLVLLGVLGLGACGSNDEAVTLGSNGTSITVSKDGTIVNSIVEEFGQSYYSEEGLKAMIESSISEYEASIAGSNIELKSCKVEDGYANVTIEYGDCYDYAGFNGVDMFFGTVADANMAGYDLNITLTDATDSTVTISKPQLLGMGDYHILIIASDGTDESVGINAYDEILYVGNGVTRTSKKSADMKLSSGYGIIVFK